MDKKTYLQYHPAACAALELELRENAEQLVISPEEPLNSKPNEIDILVIRKDEGAVIRSGLGEIFKRINIWEYKNPRDLLGERIYYRTLGYAGLYLAYQAKDAAWEDVTLSFLREAKPVKLLRMFKEKGFFIDQRQPGIYHIRREGHMDMQIVVTRELNKKEYRWITKLTRHIEREDVTDMQAAIRDLKDGRELLNAESVYDLMCRMNKNNPVIKEERAMGETRELFREEFEMHERIERELREQLEEERAKRKQSDAQLEQERKRIQELEAQLAAVQG